MDHWLNYRSIMAKLAQAGIAISFLGGVITLIGLFPGIIGMDVSPGIGILQILVILGGFSILIFGAFVYVQSAYYWGVKHNLAQQIGLRLSMTGLVLATAAGLADVLGYGSHPIGVEAQKPFLGNWQATGLIGGFVVASIGVIIFAVMGHPEPPDESEP
jgi:hypothetical protein